MLCWSLTVWRHADLPQWQLHFTFNSFFTWTTSITVPGCHLKHLCYNTSADTMAFNSFHLQSGLQMLQQQAPLCWVFECLPAARLPAFAAALWGVQASLSQSACRRRLSQMHAVHFRLQTEQSAAVCQTQNNQLLSSDHRRTCRQNVCRAPAIHMKHSTHVKCNYMS